LAPRVALHWLPVTPGMAVVVPEIRLVPPVVVVPPEPIAVSVDGSTQIKFTQSLLRQSEFTAHAAPSIFPQPPEPEPAVRVLEPTEPVVPSRLPKVPPPPFVPPTMDVSGVGVAVAAVVAVPSSEE